MIVTRNSTGRAMTLPGGILLGACTSLLWTIAGAAILALLIDKEILAQTAIGYGSMVILLTASLIGSQTAWRKVKHQRVLVCMSAGGMYFLMLLAMTALFFGGQYEAMGVTAGLILAGSGCATFMGAGKGRGHGHRVRKIHR